VRPLDFPPGIAFFQVEVEPDKRKHHADRLAFCARLLRCIGIRDMLVDEGRVRHAPAYRMTVRYTRLGRIEARSCHPWLRQAADFQSFTRGARQDSPPLGNSLEGLRGDLAGKSIARSVHFAPLMDDAKAFAKVAIVDEGVGVSWPVQTKWGRLDVSATTLRRIAEEQKPMTGTDFAEWRMALGLSLTEAAKLLGLGRRTIMGYLKRDDLPPVVAIACRTLARDKHVLAAHYVPARKVSRPAA
jgi:hypothetical protein